MSELLNTVIGPFTAKIWLAIGAALALAAWAVVEIVDNAGERTVRTAKEAGASGAVAEGQKSILDQVEKANEAEDRVRRGGDAERYERCLRYATPDTRSNCDAFKPVPD